MLQSNKCNIHIKTVSTHVEIKPGSTTKSNWNENVQTQNLLKLFRIQITYKRKHHQFPQQINDTEQ